METRHRTNEVASEIDKSCNAHLTALYVIDPMDDSDSLIFENNRELIEWARMMDGYRKHNGKRGK